MNKLLLITSFLLLSKLIAGQVDTINSLNELLDLTKLPFGSSAYTVYYEDSAKNKMGSTEMWQRNCHLKNQSEKILFQWNWYRDDSLLMQTINLCDKKSLAPEFRNLTYKQQAQVQKEMFRLLLFRLSQLFLFRLVTLKYSSIAV